MECGQRNLSMVVTDISVVGVMEQRVCIGVRVEFGWEHCGWCGVVGLWMIEPVRRRCHW